MLTNMQPVKPEMDVQSKKPAMESSNKKSIGLNKNCKATVNSKKQKKCKYDDFQSQYAKFSDKNRQEKENSNMWPVIKKSVVQLPKTEIIRLCKDKNYQSTRCYKSPVRLRV